MYRIGLMALAATLASCTVSGPDPVRAVVGLPNPAAVYCIERGGTLDIQQQPQGTVTYCVLADGKRIEEWEFYRANHPGR